MTKELGKTWQHMQNKQQNSTIKKFLRLSIKTRRIFTEVFYFGFRPSGRIPRPIDVWVQAVRWYTLPNRQFSIRTIDQTLGDRIFNSSNRIDHNNKFRNRSNTIKRSKTKNKSAASKRNIVRVVLEPRFYSYRWFLHGEMDDRGAHDYTPPPHPLAM